MELFSSIMGLAAGAEIVGATVAGKGARLAIAVGASVVSLALPEAIDPAMMLVEFFLARRIG
jgi:hypothetical protein